MGREFVALIEVADKLSREEVKQEKKASIKGKKVRAVHIGDGVIPKVHVFSILFSCRMFLWARWVFFEEVIKGAVDGFGEFEGCVMCAAGYFEVLCFGEEGGEAFGAGWRGHPILCASGDEGGDKELW